MGCADSRTGNPDVFSGSRRACPPRSERSRRPFRIYCPSRPPVFFVLDLLAFRFSHFFTALNLPGMFAELLVSLPTSWPAMWHPAAILGDSWRSLSMPFYCLPAWWLVGRGLDSLFARRRMHWALGLTGSLLCVLFLVVFCGLRFGISGPDQPESWIFWGLGFWTIGFAVLPVAWITRRVSKCEGDCYCELR
jgi:hypothetical protein